MKKIIFSLFILFSIGFTSCFAQVDIVGRWEIYRTEKPNQQTKFKREKYLVFRKDGTFIGGKINSDKIKHGTWRYLEITKYLHIKGDEEDKDDGYWKVESIHGLLGGNMVLMKDSVFVHLKKVY
jgi:hypothetical protein